LALFIDEPTNELRQGDICFEWPVPKWVLTGYQLISNPGADNFSNSVLALHAKGEPVPIVICSHDCDLENPRGRAGFLVAPLLHWPGWPSRVDMGSEQSLRIISSAKPSPGGAYDDINLFPVKLPTDPPDWRLVDYSTITSISPPEKLIPILRAAKRYEMSDEGRASFADKLAASFIRKN
jgi:hypothetical protein